jgi:hypothetical protein
MPSVAAMMQLFGRFPVSTSKEATKNCSVGVIP